VEAHRQGMVHPLYLKIAAVTDAGSIYASSPMLMAILGIGGAVALAVAALALYLLYLVPHPDELNRFK
jgi:hypothetical protein